MSVTVDGMLAYYCISLYDVLNPPSRTDESHEESSYETHTVFFFLVGSYVEVSLAYKSIVTIHALYNRTLICVVNIVSSLDWSTPISAEQIKKK